MSDYISRDAAIVRATAVVTDYGILCDVKEALESIPAAEVQPVRRGRWQITDAWPHNVYCSECHKRFAQTHWTIWEDGSMARKFCSNCGARMEPASEEASND